MKKDKNKQVQKTGAKETSIVRSSAAEYLTFVAASGQGGVEAVYADENIRLTQKMMGVLKKVFSDSELEENAVIRNFRITAADGKNRNYRPPEAVRCSRFVQAGLRHFSLQPLFSDLMNREVRMPRSTGRARAAFGKLIDTLHDSVKQVVDVHGRSLLVVGSALTYRRDGESVGTPSNFELHDA
jgi:hypothetical protein